MSESGGAGRRNPQSKGNSVRCQNEPIRVAIVTNVVPSYRVGFYHQLRDVPDLALVVYCQDSLKGWNLKPVHDELGIPIRIVRAAGGERFVSWQFLPLRELATNFDVIVFGGSVRALSTFFATSLLRLIGCRIVIWTQGHTAGARFGKVRFWFYRIFNNLLLYTQQEADALIKSGFPATNVIGINNGLDQDAIDAESQKWTPERLESFRDDQQLRDRTVFLSVARLDPKNHFEQMVQALAVLRQSLPSALWCVIGDGAARSDLEDMVRSHGLSSHVRWLGALYEESLLAPWFLSAVALVHPGAIGLSLMHAFGYGLPVITHGTAREHMPEFSAFENGKHGLCFRLGDIEDLARQCARIAGDEAERKAMGKAALETVRRHYNTHEMAARFARCVRAAASEIQHAGRA